MKKKSSRGPQRRSKLKTKKRSAKYQLTKDTKIEYKNITLLQKFVTDRGKIVPRRISGVTGKEQNALCLAIKRARFLGLLTSGSAKRQTN